ncbi:TPA: hypothetical protein ACH3X1_008468 [Trebouxia sp. C0004]
MRLIYHCAASVRHLSLCLCKGLVKGNGRCKWLCRVWQRKLISNVTGGAVKLARYPSQAVGVCNSGGSMLCGKLALRKVKFDKWGGWLLRGRVWRNPAISAADIEGVPRSIPLPGPQPALIERALQQCSSLVRVTVQRSTLNSSSHHQARQAALCRIILDERASLEQVQTALQSAVIGYRVAVRKPRFAALRGDKDRAEQIAAGLATKVQNLQGRLQVDTLQGQKTALTGRVLQLEEQNVTLGEEAASLQKRLDATVLQQHQVVNLEQQVDDPLSQLKEEQQGKAAAVMAAVEDLQRQHQIESTGQRSQIERLQQCLAQKTEQHDKLVREHDHSLEASNVTVQELTFQLSASTSVTTGQKAELSKKEAQLKRLDGELSEQQTKMMHLQSLVSREGL